MAYSRLIFHSIRLTERVKHGPTVLRSPTTIVSLRRMTLIEAFRDPRDVLARHFVNIGLYVSSSSVFTLNNISCPGASPNQS